MSPLQSSTSEQLQTIQKCQAIEAGNGKKRERENKRVHGEKLAV